MTNRLEEITRRKQTLIAQCGREREELAALWTNLRPPVTAASIGLVLAKIVKNYPLWFTGLAGWLLSRRAKLLIRSASGVRGALKWWKAIYPLWSLWRTIRRRK